MMANQRRSRRHIATPHGPARAHLLPASQPRGTVVLGHGAGGGVDAPDLAALARELPRRGWTVVLVEQPWRVAGRRVAGPPVTLDAAWVPVITALHRGRRALPGPLVVGGRSAGARVACRTAAEVGADAVVALAFPLHPPGSPERSRVGELVSPVVDGIDVLVVQGATDRFGTPGEVCAAVASVHAGPGRGQGRLRVEPVRGGHGFTPAAMPRISDAVHGWLRTRLPTG